MSSSTTHHISHSKENPRSERKAQRVRDLHNQHEQRELKEQREIQELESSIKQASPDGRPAHPTLRAKETLLLAAGSFLAILAISGVTLALWGADEAYLVFGFGIALAIIGNPVIWAMVFRSKERESIEQDRKELPNDRENDELNTQ